MLKTNILSHSCIVSLLCVYMVNNTLIGNFSSIPIYKEMEVIDDLPLRVNCDKYLISLEKIIYFVNLHRSYVDLNLFFGIFLTNVNLKQTMYMRGPGLSHAKRYRLERLLKTNDEITRYFFGMVRIYLERITANDNTPVGISTLFTNESSWPNHMRNFNIELLNKTTFYRRQMLHSVYSKWPLYKANVENYYAESDVCLEFLSQNIFNGKPELVYCHLPITCTKTAIDGERSGYGMLQRILFFILARNSRGCMLISPEEDTNILDNMCASAYNEAEFMAYHCFETADLLMGIMSLCSLEGHAQFVRRSWIDEMIDHQTVLGCFNVTRPGTETAEPKAPKIENLTWHFILPNHMIMNGMCNVRTTGFAAGMLSAAIRYILENYY